MTSPARHGDPAAWAAALDDMFGEPNLSTLADIEQIAALYRAAGWPDIAIGAALTVNVPTYVARSYIIHHARRVV
jgi:hypothetical protein